MKTAMQWMACLLVAGAALAAEPAAQPADDAAAESSRTLEPAVNTSADRPAPAPQSAAPTTAAPAAAAANGTPASAGGTNARAPAATPKGTKGVKDRLELETTQITGNRELPRVMYVVPWKRADLGDLTGRPVNSLLDEVLAPVDRDVFRRQNRYYDALRPDAAAPGP